MDNLFDDNIDDSTALPEKPDQKNQSKEQEYHRNYDREHPKATVRFSPEEHEPCTSLAKKQGVSLSEFIREAVNTQMARIQAEAKQHKTDESHRKIIEKIRNQLLEEYQRTGAILTTDEENRSLSKPDETGVSPRDVIDDYQDLIAILSNLRADQRKGQSVSE